ncbi:hypothetical protein ACN38_g4736, partial [Penicillium nordicum]
MRAGHTSEPATSKHHSKCDKLQRDISTTIITENYDCYEPGLFNWMKECIQLEKQRWGEKKKKCR